MYSLPVLNRSSEVKFSVSAPRALRKSNRQSTKSLARNARASFKRPATIRKYSKGMTLLEILIALAVVSIVLTVVAPNVNTIVSKNRTTSEINELSGIIQFARFTAIDETSTAVVCPAADYASCGTNWNAPKIVFIDINSNNTRDNAEPLLMSTAGTSASNTMTGPSTNILFFDSGATNASTSIKVCPNNKDNTLARSININAQGRVRISTDSNDNGVKEDTDGNELSCS